MSEFAPDNSQEGIYRVTHDEDGWHYEKLCNKNDLNELIEGWRENPGEVYFNENENLAVEQCIEDLEALFNE